MVVEAENLNIFRNGGALEIGKEFWVEIGWVYFELTAERKHEVTKLAILGEEIGVSGEDSDWRRSLMGETL